VASTARPEDRGRLNDRSVVTHGDMTTMIAADVRNEADREVREEFVGRSPHGHRVYDWSGDSEGVKRRAGLGGEVPP
jgi:hypothetical protein